ncbi:unnamed protein product [Symbiodinium sp. CCMP2592]|nr:unnamed protein product [Symbiodinium sp. CCMP2592]
MVAGKALACTCEGVRAIPAVPVVPSVEGGPGLGEVAVVGVLAGSPGGAVAAYACAGVVGKGVGSTPIVGATALPSTVGVSGTGEGGGGPAGLHGASPTLPLGGLLTGVGGGGPAGALEVEAGGAVASSPELGGLGGLSDDEVSGAALALAFGLPDRDLDGLPRRASLGDIPYCLGYTGVRLEHRGQRLKVAALECTPQLARTVKETSGTESRANRTDRDTAAQDLSPAAEVGQRRLG